MKTGAARIALGAFAEGVEDLVIMPIGLAFEDRVAFRGRAFVEVGMPLVLAGQRCPSCCRPAGRPTRTTGRRSTG